MLHTLITVLIALLPAQSGAVGKADRPAPAPWIELTADPILTRLTAPAGSQWILLDDGAALDPATDGASAGFAAGKDGRYRIVVVSAKEIARVAITKGDVPLPPTPPKPGPDVPPAPPTPVDPLVAKFAAAFAADTRDAAAKKKDLDALVKLYAKVAAAPDSPALTTIGELVAIFKKLALEFAVLGLAELRKLVAAELASVFTTDAPLDDAGRAKAKAMFLRLSAALAGVK